jgi:hypothetical protein
LALLGSSRLPFLNPARRVNAYAGLPEISNRSDTQSWSLLETPAREVRWVGETRPVRPMSTQDGESKRMRMECRDRILADRALAGRPGAFIPGTNKLCSCWWKFRRRLPIIAEQWIKEGKQVVKMTRLSCAITSGRTRCGLG